MSRVDADGLWWHDEERTLRGTPARSRLVPVPDTGWEMPAELPRIDAGAVIGVDVETCDEGLQAGRGPGGVTGAGYVAGIAVAVDDAAWYFPLQHDNSTAVPYDVHSWLRDTLAGARLVVGHNLLYDLEWLRAECVRVTAPCFDTMMAAAMLDENRLTYDLDSVARATLAEQKDAGPMYEWLAASFGGKPTREAQAGRIHRAPSVLVGPYAEQDARLAVRLYRAQRELLLREQLGTVAALEFGLLPLLLDMRFHGVAVDVDAAERARDKLRQRITERAAKLRERVGFAVDVWAADSVARALRAAGVTHFASTPSGKVSITKPWLEAHSSDVARLVVGIRSDEKLVGTFLEGYVLGAHASGRIHCQFHPLKTDNSGTVSGRFSSSNPNLQNIPARDAEANALLRGLYVPDDPSHVWHSLDYSQIEYRLLAHHAVGDGAALIRKRYNDDATTDYHNATGEMIREKTGTALGRTYVKNINFGLVYGMGRGALAEFLGVDSETADELFAAYHQALPFVSRTFAAAEIEARRYGVIHTVLGRACRFPLFERVDGGYSRNPADGRRAHTHKSLNRRLQGGAADVMKQAMLDCYRAGMPVPLVTVHDELAYSAPHDAASIGRVREIMEHCVKLSVPLLVKHKRGATWGACA